MAGDTESLNLRSDKLPTGRGLDGILQYISEQAMQGANTVEFKLAVSGVSAGGLPVRLIIGGRFVPCCTLCTKEQQERITLVALL